MKSLRNIAAAVIFAFANNAFAGIDITGTVTGIQQAPDGTLYFAICSSVASTYCANHWAGLNMLIPAGDPMPITMAC
jgi:hypothetical protein